eukprot:TRINITY_DN2765_c0_g1_i2.p1 TRINITY_DN2765_c0_g1~~TRINITY_DN2765_c0_g1_i2.p1  ORF type:complete len:467 (-),score=101.33 TRINITY_DN2765_c0_g1_i2:212-1417(-)
MKHKNESAAESENKASRHEVNDNEEELQKKKEKEKEKALQDEKEEKNKKDLEKEKEKEKENKKVQSVMSGDKLLIKANGVCYMADKIIGNGSFGVVFLASVVDGGEMVAIKKVLQDKRFKNRELQIMKMLNHPNIVALRNSFYTNGDKPDELFLNLVLEYVPDTVYRVARNYSKMKQPIPYLYVKLYTYQLCSALAYLHAQGICHRDIKPQNLLLDPQTGVLKLCDFGSAKMLVPGEQNVSYICSRYYRAPELIFGSQYYSTAIDLWSLGCVMGELMLGQPLFPGDSGVDQLVEIIKVLGTPSHEEIQAMNPSYTEFKFPLVKPTPWTKVYRARTPPEAIDLVSQFLQYIPSDRLTAKKALHHSFFDELKNPNCRLPNNRLLPHLEGLEKLPAPVTPTTSN